MKPKCAIYCCVLLLLAIFHSQAYAESKRMRVAFINPTAEDARNFWNELIEYMQKAARDLDIDLHVYHANHNRFEAVRLVEKVATHNPPFDYLIHLYYRGQDNQIFKITDKAKLKTFTINAQIPLSERELVGKPRGHYANWLGEMAPNDEQAGYLLTSYLIKAAKNKGLATAQDKVHLLAMTANKESEIASLRNRGLQHAVGDYRNAVLEQFVINDWMEDKASARKLDILINRYKDLSIIWAVSDAIALAAVDKMPELGLTPGKNILIGGIDGTKEALLEIQKGKMAASAIGHSLEGAWALVLLYDHFHNIDFSQNYLQSRSKYELATADNVDIYMDLALDPDKKDIDFRQFSKHINPQIKVYDFSFENLLKNSKLANRLVTSKP